MDSSRKTRPSSRPQRSRLTVPGSIPMTRGISTPNLQLPTPKLQAHDSWELGVGNWELTASLRLRRGQFVSHGGYRFGIQNEIVLLEQLRDAGLVNLHLQVTDPQRAERRHAISHCAVVTNLYPFHAERRNRVDVGSDLEARSADPGRTWDQADAGRPCIEKHLGAVERLRGTGTVGHRDLANRATEA